MSEVLIRVAVDAPLYQALTYQWKFSTAPTRGLSVRVPLGRRETTGVILSPPTVGDSEASDYKLKAVNSLFEDERPILPGPFLDWLEWLADYYVHPIGHVTALAFPPLKKAKKLLSGEKRKSKRAPVIAEMAATAAPKLMPEQTKVCADIKTEGGFAVHLIHGVTGSGKTEIYMHLLEKVITKNKTGLMLVPEIALTPQLVNRFVGRFGDKVAVIHSHLTPREKTNQWWAMQSGEKKILIGARSALFCPIPDLGLIVIDEEHEGSYKQEEKLKYHARDAAVMLGKHFDIPVILGSATPSLESWHNSQTGKYTYHQLKNRVSDRPLPQTEVVDLRVERKNKKDNFVELPYWLSESLHAKIAETLEKKEQVALFLNRRGVAQSVLCGECGFIHMCPNCAISLTLHSKRNLVCHYCDYAELMQEICPHCKQGEIVALGLGTEQIETDLGKLFPEAKLARADRDEVQNREELESMISKMENRETDILIGTQMIAKGLDFTGLTLVGLVLADVGFNMPDFRAVERSYQLLTQVSGRSGRHVEDGGQVVIQTYNPEYEALQMVLHGNFKQFADGELKVREELNYPPFGRLAGIRIQSTKDDRAHHTAEQLALRAERLKKTNENYRDIQILGPAPAPLHKLRGKFRYHVLLKAAQKANQANRLSQFCKQLLGDQKWVAAGTKVQVDVDPIHLM